MQTKAACKPWLHTNHGWPTLIPYDVIFISDGKKMVENTQIWWCCVKIGEKRQNHEKWGIIFWGKVQNGIRSTPLYRCFQCANFDTPHGRHEFCVQFWPTGTDSHAVSHFKELWQQPAQNPCLLDSCTYQTQNCLRAPNYPISCQWVMVDNQIGRKGVTLLDVGALPFRL